jgi:hypothetical protein
MILLDTLDVDVGKQRYRTSYCGAQRAGLVLSSASSFSFFVPLLLLLFQDKWPAPALRKQNHSPTMPFPSRVPAIARPRPMRRAPAIPHWGTAHWLLKLSWTLRQLAPCWPARGAPRAPCLVWSERQSGKRRREVEASWCHWLSILWTARPPPLPLTLQSTIVVGTRLKTTRREERVNSVSNEISVATSRSRNTGTPPVSAAEAPGHA